ncbi:alpha-amylase family glycosyl hydrolase, partial [Klebsiella pneumoniae]
GDLASVRSKLGYVKELGADVVYLSPIFQAPTNHKYDTENYFKIAPEFGTKQDLEGLIKDVHAGGMKLMLDGVFNHIGVTSPIFQEAKN